MLEKYVFFSKVLALFGLSCGHAAPQQQTPRVGKEFRASVGPGFNGDPSLAKIIAEQRFLVDGGNKFGHAAHQVCVCVKYFKKNTNIRFVLEHFVYIVKL